MFENCVEGLMRKSGVMFEKFRVLLMKESMVSRCLKLWLFFFRGFVYLVLVCIIYFIIKWELECINVFVYLSKCICLICSFSGYVIKLMNSRLIRG